MAQAKTQRPSAAGDWHLGHSHFNPLQTSSGSENPVAIDIKRDLPLKVQVEVPDFSRLRATEGRLKYEVSGPVLEYGLLLETARCHFAPLPRPLARVFRGNIPPAATTNSGFDGCSSSPGSTASDRPGSDSTTPPGTPCSKCLPGRCKHDQEEPACDFYRWTTGGDFVKVAL